MFPFLAFTPPSFGELRLSPVSRSILYMSYKDYNLKSNNRAKYGPYRGGLFKQKYKNSTPRSTSRVFTSVFVFLSNLGPSVNIIELTTHDAIHPGVKPIVVTGRLLLMLLLMLLMLLFRVAGS